MNIQYTKLPGYGLGIQFHDISRELRDEVVKFVNHNVQCRNASHHEAARQAAPFLQCDGFRNSPNETEGYVFLEFWSASERHWNFCEALLARLREFTGNATLAFEGFR